MVVLSQNDLTFARVYSLPDFYVIWWVLRYRDGIIMFLATGFLEGCILQT